MTDRSQNHMHPHIGVKFCGGCNPRYDRRGVLNRLERENPGVHIGYVSGSDSAMYDVALILCGCSAECLDFSELSGKQGRIVVDSEDDYEKIDGFMKSWYVKDGEG